MQITLRKKSERAILDPADESLEIGGLLSIATASDHRRLFPNLVIEVRQGGALLQLVRVHVSCSQPLAVGDQFGSLIVRQIIGY